MGKETGGLTTAVIAGGRICTSTRRTRKQKDALDGRDASHTVLSGHSLLDQGTAAGALQQPVVLGRPRRWRGARGIDEVSTRGSHGACLAAAELEERLSRLDLLLLSSCGAPASPPAILPPHHSGWRLAANLKKASNARGPETSSAAGTVAVRFFFELGRPFWAWWRRHGKAEDWSLWSRGWGLDLARHGFAETWIGLDWSLTLEACRQRVQV